MRSLLKVLLLVPLLAVVLTACSRDTSGLAFGPSISVTPATAPISIPGVTPPAVAVAEASEGSFVAVAEAAEVEGVTPTVTPTPLRTPIRIKVPATPFVPTETSTPIPFPTATPTTEVVVDTPTSEPSTAEPPTPEPPTATPEPPTAEPPPVQEVVAVAPTTRPLGLDHTLNILIVGSDERTTKKAWRSDVIMVAAVDFANREVGVVSFPRDLWVTIPTVGENRINTATFWGGLYNYPNGGSIGLLADTIERNFGIRIDQYVKINFDSFKEVVDALGGIDVTVDCPIYGRFPRSAGSTALVYKTLQPGDYHMDGTFALRYVRERKSTSDVDRTRRQQRVLIALRNRAREVNIIPRVPALYDAMRSTIETDLGLTDIIALARLGVQVDPSDAHGFIIGFKETKSWVTPAGAAVLLPRMGMIMDGINNLFNQPSILKNPNKPHSCPSVEEN